MKIKRVSTVLCVFLSIFSLLFCGGVSATWIFAEPTVPSVDGDFSSVSISVFDYNAEEILPGGGVEIPDIGQNHYTLIDKILNETNKNYGLNQSTSNVLHSYLKSKGVVYSNQKVSGGNLKFIIDPQNNTHGLYFVLEKVSDTHIHCYTFTYLDLVDASGTSKEMAVYQTHLIKTNEWNMTTSHKGLAKTVRLSDIGVSADSNSSSYSIDIESWYSVE